MKKKFVLTLALVLMVAGTLVAATPIEVSGSFKTGYEFSFNPNGISQIENGNEAELETIVAFSGDFWKVSLATGLTANVLYWDEAPIAAKAELYLDKALAEEGIDMGDLGLTLIVGNGVGGDALTVLADKNAYADDYVAAVTPIGMSSTGDNFGVKVTYSDMVEVYASVDPTDTANFPMVLSAKLMPVDGVEAAVGFTNDYSGNNAMTVSAKGDVASLVGLEDITLVATGEFLLDLGAETSAIVADVETSVSGIGLWAAYYNSMANVNYMAAKASYSTTVEDFDLSASFKLDLGDIAASSDEEYTIAAGAKYAMGGATYALDAEYVIDGTFKLTPSVSISF